MRQLFVVFVGGILCCGARAGNIDCVKFLNIGDTKICMKTLKETAPSLAAKFGDDVYYAGTTPEYIHGMHFRYDGHDYSLYNRDDTEYELIHWLSGEDALVNGVWRDRLADTTTDTGGPLNFRNNGCTWNDEHTGYYSDNGLGKYFISSGKPTFDFGADWYVEVEAQVGEPLGDVCFFVDFGALMQSNFGMGLGMYKRDVDGVLARLINVNSKANYKGHGARTTGVLYNWGEKISVIAGETRYSLGQSRAFVTYDGNRYYGSPYDTWQWNEWTAANFYLFRGTTTQWSSSSGTITNQCGPTTIYDIKVWRKK